MIIKEAANVILGSKMGLNKPYIYGMDKNPYIIPCPSCGAKVKNHCPDCNANLERNGTLVLYNGAEVDVPWIYSTKLMQIHKTRIENIGKEEKRREISFNTLRDNMIELNSKKDKTYKERFISFLRKGKKHIV